jgi:riboflavin kinase/FMN adenylyltransferase
MSTPLQINSVDGAGLPAGPVHLAIGIFDGVHLGHRAVIEAAVQSARRSGGVAAVLTFAPHPSALLRPEQPTPLIMGSAAKARVLGGLGVQVVITHPFTPAFAQIGAHAFLPWLRERLPALAAVYVGENWRFGRGREGGLPLLVEQGRQLGLGVFSAPRVALDGEPISSSRIRTALSSGDVAGANRMLGYSYFAEGLVTGGKQLGRMLGFPTLNVSWAPELRPHYGVYAVRVRGVKSERSLPGVANYGLRPTVEKATAPRLEAHVLEDWCPYDAGDVITVDWLEFLRPEMKFSGVGELRVQITRDRDAARSFFWR